MHSSSSPSPHAVATLQCWALPGPCASLSSGQGKDRGGCRPHLLAADPISSKRRPIFSPPSPGEFTARPSCHSSSPRVAKPLQRTHLSVTAAMDASWFPPERTVVASTAGSISGESSKLQPPLDVHSSSPKLYPMRPPTCTSPPANFNAPLSSSSRVIAEPL